MCATIRGVCWPTALVKQLALFLGEVLVLAEFPQDPGSEAIGMLMNLKSPEKFILFSAK